MPASATAVRCFELVTHLAVSHLNTLKKYRFINLENRMCLLYQQSNNTVTANGIEFHYALAAEISKPVLALVNMASVNAC
jgi:hypothetical protein